VDIDRPELGYWSHPDARGRGVTTEAVDLALRYVFSPALGLRRMTVRAAVGNTASRRVVERAGMRLVGVCRADELLPSGPERHGALRRPADGSARGLEAGVRPPTVHAEPGLDRPAASQGGSQPYLTAANASTTAEDRCQNDDEVLHARAESAMLRGPM